MVYALDKDREARAFDLARRQPTAEGGEGGGLARDLAVREELRQSVGC